MSDKELPYFEGFFCVVMVEDAIITMPINQDQYRLLEWKVAECNIPLKTDNATYCMIAMLPHLDASTPAIAEMFLLQAVMPDVVEQFRDHFHEVSH